MLYIKVSTIKRDLLVCGVWSFLCLKNFLLFNLDTRCLCAKKLSVDSQRFSPVRYSWCIKRFVRCDGIFFRKKLSSGIDIDKYKFFQSNFLFGSF